MEKIKKRKTIFYLGVVTILLLVFGYQIYFSPIRLIGKHSPNNSGYVDYSEVTIQDNNLFILMNGHFEYPETLLAFDISDRGNPEIISETMLPELLGNVGGITIDGDYLFIVSSKRGILIVDISDAQSPQIVTAYNGATNGFYNSPLLINNNTGYIREYIKDEDYEQLHILSLEDPLAITELSITRNGGEPLLVENTYLYTRVERSETQQLDNYDYLSLLDISDLSSPFVVKEFYNFIQLMAVEIQGDKMYISAHDNILVADISDPINPIILGDLDGYVDKFVADNNYIYYLYTFGVGVLDVSNPSSPVIIDQSLIRQGRDFVLVDEFIYLANASDGLFVYKINQKIPLPFLKLSSLWYQGRVTLSEIWYRLLGF